ncbi:hypothetical protein PAAG_11205 [Paracoccidioides lutzii Pb01]|uniref:Uncharacterized protein n=1 Tax=Paracoccidioides lutzii (strain ATCC MYA-826 / Pb01) TaxID=502779 RepID=A0A0A2VMF3_PARBA|nr:hypothetical protein PAAG_11205 [Paracoccidioides lutzii Pb01]KGQ02029.1 hypothetical protein PAAG_11205 [Paracoccidioides lutzii Pb01]
MTLDDLKALEAFPSEDLIFHIFYSALPTAWRNYVQKKIEEVQTSKYTVVILDVIPITKEIQSQVGPSKNKKKNAPPSTQVNAANLSCSESYFNTQPSAYHGCDLGDPTYLLRMQCSASWNLLASPPGHSP